jgi:hypothetical protein
MDFHWSGLTNVGQIGNLPPIENRLFGEAT